MRVDEALAGVALMQAVQAADDVQITGVQYDSRCVQSGDLFVAMRGGSSDGSRFIAAAITAGAVAILTDSADAWRATRAAHPELAVGLVENGRRALAAVSANVYGHPERRLKISAVTGTNGKTTTAYLLEQLLKAAGRKCLLIGTIETHVADEVRVSEHTTPESRDLYALFADAVAAGATEVVMEMSSHALEQERVWGVPVDVAIFTNLTQDHLDYHGTMEAYGAAKARLFAGVGAPAPRVALINADDSQGGVMRAAAGKCAEVWTYGTGPDCTCAARDISIQPGRTEFTWVTPWRSVKIVSPLTGMVNVLNLLAAMNAAQARGVSHAAIADAVPQLKQVPGRFETVTNSLGFAVVVDYAHTDDALRNLIGLARELVKATHGRVITLFGCGGDRDKSKRPKMGRAAGEGSDLVVLTSDNPRTEEPASILAEALAGVRETAAECRVIEDRRAAIAFAIGAARAGDIVLIAGKGHEKVQILRDRTVPFDDVAVAAEVLRGM